MDHPKPVIALLFLNIKGMDLYDTLADGFYKERSLFPLLLDLASRAMCRNEASHGRNPASNGLFCQLQNKMQTKCTIRT